MSVTSGLLRRLAAAADVLGVGRATVPGPPAWTNQHPWQPSAFALEFPKAVALVPIVNAVVMRIAHDMAKLTCDVYRTARSGQDEKLAREPGNLVDLLAKANRQQTGFEFERDRQAYLDAAGNSYVYLERFGRKPGTAPMELWALAGHMVRPIAGPGRTVVAYRYGLVDGLTSNVTDGQLLDPKSVIAFHYHNPDVDLLTPPIGLSPLEAARVAYETRHDMNRWQRAFYQRGGQAALVLSAKDGTAFSDQAARDVQERIERQARGIHNAFRPLVLRNMEVVRAGMTMAEMQFLESSGMTGADVCNVFQVPPEMFGFGMSAKSTGARLTPEILLAYCDGALEPRAALRDSVYTEQLCPLFDDVLYCKTDMAKMLPVQAARLDLIKSLVIATGRPVMSGNEARAIADLPRNEDDETMDEMLVPTGMTTADSLEGEAPPAGAPAAPPGGAKTDPQSPEVADQSGGDGPTDDVEMGRRGIRALKASDGRMAFKRRRADADLARYERRVARWASAHFSAQEEKCLARLRSEAGATAQAARFGIDPDSLLEPDESDAESVQALFEQLLQERGEAAAAEIGVDIAIDVATGRWGALVRERGTRLITQIDETTRDLLRKSLSEGLASGESFDQLVGRVRRCFDMRRGNAMTIARTETAWAYNLGALEAWRQGGVTQKSWLTVGDEVVRPTHTQCEAQGPIPMDQTFSNGLQYPAEEGGEAGEVINCRCVLQPEGVAGYVRRASRNGHANGVTNRLAHLFARSR